ncbi:MAG TPA: hypothetical protein VE709_06110 [Pseudonocardiaceae bacterium]|jgi:hypothetical protein|nr:hypothetical protein [Pseudonocardiaceae bacterium]
MIAIAGMRSGRWWCSYAAMVAAMLTGMVLGHAITAVLLGDRAEGDLVMLLAMAFWMTVAMVVWMTIRRHPQRAISRMAAAMNLPFAVVVPLLAAGSIQATTATVSGHAAMLVLMAISMLIDDDVPAPRLPAARHLSG